MISTKLIQAAERQLETSRHQKSIRQALVFDRLRLPELDIPAVEQVLREDLPRSMRRRWRAFRLTWRHWVGR